MAIVTTDDKHYKDIARVIRGLSIKPSSQNIQYKPSEMIEGIDRLALENWDNGYTSGTNSGYQSGYSEGKVEGIEQGERVAYDAFWDAFQNNGGEMNYYYAFAYGRFTDANYNPKYDIVCSTGTTTSSQSIFNAASEITDTKVAIYANGRQANAMFAGCTALKTITKLVVHEDLTYSNTFSGCSALEDITIEGTIGKAIDFSPCKKLNRTSIESIISALSDSTSGLEARFSAEAVGAAFAVDGEWDAYVDANAPNWAISLV